MPTAVENAAAQGLTSLFDYGAAMVVLVLVLVAAAYTIRYLLNRCDERFEQALQRQESITTKVVDVLDRNTLTYAQNSILLQDVKDTLRDMKRGL